jgi:transposase-like protein
MKLETHIGEKFLSELQRQHIALNPVHLQRMVQAIVQTAMEIEVTITTAAPRYERHTTRRVYRNGYRDSLWQIGMEKIPLRIPRVRRGTYHPTFLHSSKRWHEILTFARLTALQGTTLECCENLLRCLGISSPPADKVQMMYEVLWQEFDQQRRAPFADHWQKIRLELWRLPAQYDEKRSAILFAVGEDGEGQRELLAQTVVEYHHAADFAEFIWQIEQRNTARIPYDAVTPHRLLRAVIRRNTAQPQMHLPIMTLFKAA